MAVFDVQVDRIYASRKKTGRVHTNGNKPPGRFPIDMARLTRAVSATNSAMVENLESRLLLSAAQTFNFNSSFNGFTTVGNDSIVDSSFYTPVPMGGTAQALMDTGAAVNGGGSTPVSASTLETALGLSATTLSHQGFGTATNGSGMYLPSTFVASAGDMVTFTANFLTTETSGGQDDFAFAVLNQIGGSATITQLGDAQGTQSDSSSDHDRCTGQFHFGNQATII